MISVLESAPSSGFTAFTWPMVGASSSTRTVSLPSALLVPSLAVTLTSKELKSSPLPLCLIGLYRSTSYLPALSMVATITGSSTESV